MKITNQLELTEAVAAGNAHLKWFARIRLHEMQGNREQAMAEGVPSAYREFIDRLDRLREIAVALDESNQHGLQLGAP